VTEAANDAIEDRLDAAELVPLVTALVRYD